MEKKHWIILYDYFCYKGTYFQLRRSRELSPMGWEEYDQWEVVNKDDIPEKAIIHTKETVSGYIPFAKLLTGWAG